jgi:hypothetical protein
MKRRKVDPRRAKLNRTYTVEEAARLFGCHRNTVRAWQRAGLKAIDGDRPALFLGEELRRFHLSRRAGRKCSTPVGMIYCMGCRVPRRPAGDMADYVARSETSGDLKGLCPVCGAWMYRRVRVSDLDRKAGDLDVMFAPADPRISQREEASVNDDSKGPAPAHAEPQS